MGMFDSVFVSCPRCGEDNEIQTKNGKCILGRYDLVNAPPEVLLGVKGNHECDSCGEWFNINVQCITKAWVETLRGKDYDR